MNTNQRDVMIAFPSLLLLVAMAIGIYSLPPPLDSSRPEVPRRPSQVASQVPARLWQDPLQAFWDLPSADLPAYLQNGAQVMQGRLDGPGRTLLLPVLIPGSGYSESHETRLRLRYAVLTALGASDYVPEQAEKIAAFKGPQAASASWLVPFEWHRHESTSEETMPEVLVLWVNEEELGDPFLHGLHELLHALLEDSQDKVTPCQQERGLCVEVIGPSSSTGLRPYLAGKGDLADVGNPKAGHDAQCQEAFCPLTRARVNSPLATTWDDNSEALVEFPDEIRLRRTIGSDRDLCKLLKDELGLRGVQPSEESLIVLITEWDTVYGRSFPETFRSEFDPGQHRFIYEYTYLRGIDGQIPGAKKSNGGSQESAVSLSSGILSAAQIERPEGRSQYDYLRRMQQQLADIRQQGEIRAVGVTGTDVYDKLLILRALRSSFPDTLFFTTDLDVRLLHPSEYDSVRNLLIASHFGLGLGADRASAQQQGQTLEDRFASLMEAGMQADGRERRVPLFRYSYQSSLFLAVLASLNPSLTEALSVPSNPRLYEVGRNGGVLLNSQGKGVHEPPGPVLALVLVLLSIGCSLMRPDFSRLRRDLTLEKAKESPARSIRELLVRKLSLGFSLYLGWLLLRLLPFAVLAGIVVLDSTSRFGEAWAVFEGVSLWPSQFLLLLIIMLAIEFAIWLAKDFEISKLKLDLTYFNINPQGWRREDAQLTLPENLSERIRFCWHEFKAQASTELRLVGTYASAARDNPDHRWGRTDVLSLWQDYCRRTSPGAVFLRLALYAWLVIPVTGLLFYWAPARPFRGDLSLWVDRGLLATALLAIGFLIVLVWDVTFFTSLFTRNLAGRESLWPKSTVQAYSKNGWPQESYTGELINEWLDVNFIARHTQSIGNLIYFPFILLLLYAVAHHPVFDNWVIRPREMLIFLGAMLVASIPLIMMRRSAESARRQAIQRLSVKTMEAQGQQDSGPRLQILQRCLGDIEAIRQGAFSSLAENPLLRAALIPFGGMGGLALLEFMLL